MEVKPKFGIDKLLFGMKEKDVVELYGKADKAFKDEDKNHIWLYNDKKIRLTFYADEEFRLGYLISTNPKLTFFGTNVMGMKAEEVKSLLQQKGFKAWEKEDFDLDEHFFNEDHWTILHSEFGVISKVEIGAIINDKDEFDWKFKT